MKSRWRCQVHPADRGAVDIGPVIRVPEDVAQRLESDTDLVEAVIDVPDSVGEPDIQLGPMPGVPLLLVETPKNGFGLLMSMITESDYGTSAPQPFELIVSDQDGSPHAFSGSSVNEQ